VFRIEKRILASSSSFDGAIFLKKYEKRGWKGHNMLKKDGKGKSQSQLLSQ
jgi:hypothetical protein